MHYKNGTEAKEGDAVIFKHWSGNIRTGTIHSLNANATSCNGIVAHTIPGGAGQESVTVGECFSAKDAWEVLLKALPAAAAMLVFLLVLACPMGTRAQAAPGEETVLQQLDTQMKESAASGRLDEKEPSPFAYGTWTISPFGSYRAHELGKFNGRFGGGLALSYAPANNIAIELETLSETWRTDPLISSLEEAGANLKGYLPFGDSGLAGYGFIGYTRNLQRDQNRMNAGAGLEVRGRRAYAFADGRWTHDFDTLGHMLFRVGGGFRF